MNELKGKFVNIVLLVHEGNRMDFIKYPIFFAAAFQQRWMESEVTQPEENPQFNSTLEWAVEKKDVRKMRSENIPLRLECYTLDHCQRKEKIGFVLLSLRNAQIVPISDRDKEMKFKWHKLLGVAKESKSHHPELKISVVIRDQTLDTTDTCISLSKSVENFVSLQKVQNAELENTLIPVSYLEDGFIQIGKDSASNKTYLLNIVLKTAYNMDLLLPEIVAFGNQTEQFYISFTIFGITVKSKPFYRDLHETIILNDRIVIRLKSNLDLLHLFFEQYNQVGMCFNCGYTKLGMANLNLSDLVPRVSEDEFLQLTRKSIRNMENCVFVQESKKKVPEGGNGRKPHINIETYLEKYINAEEKRKQGSGKLITSMVDVNRSGINLLRPASGDQSPRHHFDVKFEAPSLSNFLEKKREIKSASANNLHDKNALKKETKKSMMNLSPTFHKLNDVHEKYQQYVLEILLDKIKWQTQFNTRKMIIKVRHPKASTELPIHCEVDNFLNEEIELHDLSLNMYFISTKSQINDVLHAWPPKLSLEDGNGCSLSKDSALQTIIFQTPLKNEARCVQELKKVSGEGTVAQLHVSMRLREYGLEETPEKPGYELFPSILDERIALKHLQELEQWKEEQKNLFAEDLTDIEKRHIEKLECQWKTKKEAMENNLTRNVKKCQAMAAQMKKLADGLKKQKEKATVLKFEKDPSVRYSESYEKLMDKYGKKYAGLTNTGLLEVIVSAEEENAQMKQQMTEMMEEIEGMKQTALTKEQTTNLLQELRGLEEKFEHAQTAKSYFKEQWKKAVREIHTLKAEDHKQLQSQMKHNWEELSQMSLDSFFKCGNGKNSYAFESLSYVNDNKNEPQGFEMKFPNLSYY